MVVMGCDVWEVLVERDARIFDGRVNVGPMDGVGRLPDWDDWLGCDFEHLWSNEGSIGAVFAIYCLSSNAWILLSASMQ